MFKQQHSSNGLGLAQIGGVVNLGGADVRKDQTVITTECGVDIRLVDATTGRVVVAENSEFRRTDTAGGLGLSILGANAHSDNQIALSQDDQGKILRMALDDALRKAMPQIDQFLVSAPPSHPTEQPARYTGHIPSGGGGGAGVTGGAAVHGDDHPTNAQPAGQTKFCPECGHAVEPGAKFCPNCGKPLK